MRAFIVRPFAARQSIDFDRVQAELITPALEKRGIAGDTTQQFCEAGNIRIDMFEQLLLADVVVADISVHNANVFYELGIRHALRAKHTVLIRAKVTKPRPERTAEDEVPFDLKTDRYLEYDHTAPAASVDELVKALTFAADARKDSPVFQSLPNLGEQDRTRFAPVPREFSEAVDSAQSRNDLPVLGLLAAEASGATWEVEGWRKVGKALFDLGATPAARRAWERIRTVEPYDVEANLRLATILQKAGAITESDQALDRVFANVAASRRDKAEGWALRGSNEKVRWAETWQAAATTAERQPLALRSPFLEKAYRAYRTAFDLDLNHFYPGLNAQALLSIRLDLIEQQPQVWADPFETPEEATLARSKLQQEQDDLRGAVRLALGAANHDDPWLSISVADYKFMTAAKAAVAKAEYEKALAYPAIFNSRSARRQLQLFSDLGLKKDRVEQCLGIFPTMSSSSTQKHVVVFNGLRVDDASKPGVSRFPDAMTEPARAAIRAKLAELKPDIAIAAAKSGGDILFHQACRELQVPSYVRLVTPANSFVNDFVVSSGQRWVGEFWSLVEAAKATRSLAELASVSNLPIWLTSKADYDIARRANWWMLEEALSLEPQRLTVFALWDGNEDPDGPSGLLERGKALGATPFILDTKEVFAAG